MRKKNALAFDIGGSKLMTGIVNENGQILTSEHTVWREQSEGSLLDDIIQSGRRLIQSFEGTIDCIGAGIPGLADIEKGVWIESCFSGIKEVPIVAILQDEFRLNAYIDNDVNLCAIAEKYFGACKDNNDFIWLTVSNGCGGALYVNGDIYRGAFSNAGELGHIVVEDNDGYLCGCGNKGCLEAQAAGPAIVRRYHRDGGLVTITSAAEVAKYANNGDKIALKTFTDEGCYLGKAIAAAANIINPETVIIGGGVAQSFDLFEKSMLNSVMQRVYKKANQNLTIKKTELGYYAPLIGAGVAALKS